MEGSRGPQLSFSHSKGATLPGYRSGPFRSSPHSSQPSTIARRSSDGDISDSKLVRDKCRKYESRFWTSYRSESPSGESGTIISDPKEPMAAWESPDLAPQFSSRPTITPLAAPASPRPQVRRSFNTFPRPWKARSRSPSPFRMKEQMNKGTSEHFHFRSFNDSLKQIKQSAGGKRENEEAAVDAVKYKISQNVENDATKSNEIAEIRPIPFYATGNLGEEASKVPSSNLYRSVATITVTSTVNTSSLSSQPSVERFPFSSSYAREENPVRKLTNILSALTSRKAGGNSEARAQTQQVAAEKKGKKLGESISESICDARGKEEKKKEKEEEQQQHPLPPHASLHPPHATKFSSNASSLPCLPDEHGSAPLSRDEENCALHRFSKQTPRQSASNEKESDNGRLTYDLRSSQVVGTEEDLRFEKADVPSGGSGPGDREAPLTESDAQGLMQASGRKSVRKKPQIPHNLSRRRCSEDGDQRIEVGPVTGSLLSPSHSFSSGFHSYRIKKTSQPFVTTQTVKSQSVSPTRPYGEEKQEFTKNRTTVSQILSTLNFARSRLEELTGALGGTKKEGGKSPSVPGGRGPPSRPPRTRRHDLEKLMKSTERLRNSEHKSSDVEPPSSDRDNVSLSPKTKTRNKSEGSSKHTFFPKQAIVRTNSSPAGVSRTSSSSLLSSLSSRLLNNENKNSETLPSTASSNFLLPPLPSPKQKSSTHARDIPFRSASVSHSDLSSEKSCSKVPPNLKVNTVCDEPWGYHTLPRCTNITQKPKSVSIYLGDTVEQIPPPLTASYHDFGKFDDSEYVDREKSIKSKSRSEMELTHLQNEEADASSRLSSSTGIVAEPNDEVKSASKCDVLEESSIIEKLLRSDFPQPHSDSAKGLISDSEGAERSSGIIKEVTVLTPRLTLDEVSLGRISNKEGVSNRRDVPRSNQFADSVSEANFEKELMEKGLNSENVRPYKDICVQTDETTSKENEKFKRRNLRGNKAKLLEERREKLRLKIDNRSFDLKPPPAGSESYRNLDEDSLLPIYQSDDGDDLKQRLRADSSGVKCPLVEIDPRGSQCLVIRSGSFNKSDDNKKGTGEEKQRATSECIVQTSQRLSLEDSEGESTDRERKSLSLQSEGSEERSHTDGVFSGMPTESSDSSSQDSVGAHFSKTRRSVQLAPLPLNEGSNYEGREEKNECRRRKKHTDDVLEAGEDPNQRDKGLSENLPSNKTNKHSKRQENLRKFNWQCDQRGSLKNDLSFSDGDSRPNSYSEPEALQSVVTACQSVEKRDRRRKKKNWSDPGIKRSRNEDVAAYFSDSNLEEFEKAKMRLKTNSEKRNHVSRSAASHRIVSQASTDSEGRDEFGTYKGHQDAFRNSGSQTPKFFNPPVIMSGQESDASCQDISSIGEYSSNRNISRNASPSPYLGDSDSGERCFPRSPHTPRRYSKRPLRGPYGEMLEAEMSKSKSSSQFLTDDIFLRPRESNSTSPRPCSPASPPAGPEKNDPFETPLSIFVESESTPSRSSPHSNHASRSLDDSALKLFYSDTAGKQSQALTKPLINVAYSSYESDGEARSTPLPTGPLHQRTASSPSKLFFEPGTTTGEDRDLLGLSSFSKADPKSRPKTPPKEEKTKSARISLDESSHKHKMKPPKSKTERYSKSPKGKKHTEEDPRPHSSLQQPPKKNSHETEFRSHSEHRHRRHRDTRAHIIGEIYDTERNYVYNLNFLLTRYEQALRTSDSNAIIEPSLVDDIFFQVPEIHDHHQRLLDELKLRLDSRNNASICVGDVLLQMLKDPTVAESYKSFVNNWKTAQEAAKSSARAKPALRHFLCAMAKEHPGKLDLKALLITPVQRFPHYELILKRLLDHTSREHPDHDLVKEAIVEVQKVAASINEIEQEALQQEQQQFILKEIENFIEGLVGLVQPDSLQLPLLSSLESCKLKLFKFISLDDLEIGRSRDDSMKKLVKELESLEQDLQTVSHISRLMKTLHFPRGNLEDALHDLDASLRKQLIDRQGSDSQLSELELNITTQEGIETLTFMFSNAEKRNKWEEGFNVAKQKLAMSADRRPPPEFMNVLPIRKTRAGLQFTCAAPTLGLNAHNLRDVWVCNSDGYVGQVCVMSLQPEPTVACCNGVCNSKILSITSIPAAPHPDTSDEDEDEEPSVEEDIRKRRSESLPPEIGVDENDNQQPTMWLGTEDGSIHVYNCNDTIRTKKNKFKFQPGSPVHCIIHIENRVFASLANGDVVVYERDNQGGWNDGERHVVSLSTAAAPVTRMVMAAGKLWCSATNNIRILNINTLQVEHSFTVAGESAKGVACMVCAGHGVWIAVHHSATVRLYHAATHECVWEVSITSPVTKMLAGCDDIIRQHKLACLKVTALLACKDLLWVGTSAGVIITLPLPHLSHNTRRLQSPLNMVGIPHGHTGNVRFLTSVEMTPETRPSRLKSHSRYSFKGKDHQHHQSGTAAPSKLLVISGGDGYEDFRNSGVSELAGRDDSTNHLLLWQV